MNNQMRQYGTNIVNPTKVGGGMNNQYLTFHGNGLIRVHDGNISFGYGRSDKMVLVVFF